MTSLYDAGELTFISRRQLEVMSQGGCGDQEVMGTDELTPAHEIGPDASVDAGDLQIERKNVDRLQDVLDEFPSSLPSC